MSIKNRFFIPVAPFAIADFIRSLENTEEVFNIFITKQDNELVVAYTYDPYRVKRVVSELDNTTCCNDDEPDESWEREKAPYMQRLTEFAIDKLLDQVGKDKVYKIEYLPKQGGLMVKTKMTLENIIKVYHNTDIILKISDIGEEIEK